MHEVCAIVGEKNWKDEKGIGPNTNLPFHLIFYISNFSWIRSLSKTISVIS